MLLAENGNSLEMGKVVQSLSASCYRVTFTAAQRLDLPEYLGSTLRGAFGRAFRTLACPSRIDEPCPIPSQCPYHLIFESSPPPGSDALRTHEEIPRPFVIASEWKLLPEERVSRLVYESGQELSFGLVLIGRAQEFFPHFVVALREMDRIGRGRRAIELARIEAIDPRNNSARIVYEARDNVVRGAGSPLTLEDCARESCPPGPVTIEFLTQTRLKHEGSWARVPEFHIVFRRLLGRLSSMARFHCGGPLDVDFKRMIDQAHEIRLIRNDTRWVSWSRYSSRQDKKMQWDGLVGTATYEGDLTPHWPCLQFGQHIHVGHGTTFGLGRYLAYGAL
ncbi:MAG: CRISPR system precrRNA processing endoribonuclease RAMP protein Cas6 [Candidatus Binataceae bacterium]